MATQLFANNAKTVLASGISAVATSLTVTAGTGLLFPVITGSDYFLATLCQLSVTGEINFEIVKVTARTSDVFTIVRAQESTTALAYVAGDKVELRLTKETMERLRTGSSDQAFITEALNTFGLATLAGGLNVSGGTDINDIWYDASTSGLQIKAKTGVVNDFRLQNASGLYIMRNPTGTSDIIFNYAVRISGDGGLGYGNGAGGTVTQATSRTTGVTLNKSTGSITLVSAAGSATWTSFTVTNANVAAEDNVTVNQKSGTDLYRIYVTNIAAGSFRITFSTTGGTTTEQPVFNFNVHKGANA